MEKVRQSVLLIAVLILMAGLANAQQPAPGAPARTGTVIRTETKVVLVDAVVTDKKKQYVRDLAAKDFHVFEDDHEQTVTSFAFEGDPASPSKGQSHYMVLFFDNSNMDVVMDQPRAREAAKKFVEANAGPDRLMAVVNFGGTLQVTQNFTSNVERLKSVVSGEKTAVMGVSDPGAAALPQLSAAAADFSARNLFLALRTLGQSLSAVPGRKTLILLSTGFKLKTEEHGSEMNAALNACNRANVAIYAVDVRGLVAGTPEKAAVQPPPARNGPGRFGRAFARLASVALPVSSPASSMTFSWQRGGPPAGGNGNWADPSKQAHLEMEKVPDSLFTNQEVLLVLADGTGGFVIRNTNDLTGGLEKIGSEQNEYYLLGYTPPEAEEASCHKLRVKVDRGGTTVRARTLYCNAKPQDALVGNPIETQLQNRIGGTAQANEGATLEAPFFYTSPNVARVNLAMEIKLDKLKAEKQKGKLHAEINVLGVAAKRDGGVAARFSDVVRFDFPTQKDLDAFTAKPLFYENQFDIGPGEYNLKVAFSTGGDGFGKAETPLSVGAYEAKDFAMSGLALSRQYGPVTDTRVGVGAMLLAGRTPLIAGGMRFVGSASNRFSNTDPAAVYAEIYEPLMASPDPKTPIGVGAGIRILDRKTGQEKADTGVLRVALPEASGNPVIPVALKVPLAALPPGSYRLELEAGDSAGKVAKSTADFEIE